MSRERGSASVLVAVAATVTLLLGVAAAVLANALAAAARARMAADLAALAGADLAALAGAGAAGHAGDACAVAARVAYANAARLVDCAAGPTAVTVVVEVPAPAVFGRPVRARARAEPGAWSSYAQLRAPPARQLRAGGPIRVGLRGWTASGGTSSPLTRWAS